MKVVIRMLSIVTIILWIVIIFFAATAVFSAMKLSAELGEPQISPSSRGITMTLPFSITNNGYYEIADLNLTSRISDSNWSEVALTQTVIPAIRQESTVNASHNVPIDMDVIMSLDHLTLLREDSEFNIELYAGLNFARAVPVQIATNATIPWGAPLAEFSVGRLTVSAHNSTHREAETRVQFENHAMFALAGMLRLDYYGDSNELLTSAETIFNVEAGGGYNEVVFAFPQHQNAPKLTSTGTVHVVFETGMFTVEWDEQYG